MGQVQPIHINDPTSTEPLKWPTEIQIFQLYNLLISFITSPGFMGKGSQNSANSPWY